MWALILLSMTFSIGCSSSKEPSKDKNEPTETYSQHETDFGLSYEVPESWKAPDTNTDASAYYYKREIGSGDGMLYIAYQMVEGDITNEILFNEFAKGLLNTNYDTDNFQSEAFEINDIKMKKFSYDMEIEQTNYKNQGVVFNCGKGIVMVSFSSFPESNYDSYFDKIISSLKITDTNEDGTGGNTAENVSQNTKAGKLVQTDLPETVSLCYETFNKVLKDSFPDYSLSGVDVKYQNESKFYSFDIIVDQSVTQPDITFFNDESSFKLSLPDDIENNVLVNLIQCTILSCEDMDEASAKKLTQKIVNGYDGTANSKILETKNYKFYISPDSGLISRYLNVISNSEINVPVAEGEYVQATNDLFNGELNQGTKAYFKGTIIDNYDLGAPCMLQVKSGSDTYVVYYDFDSFINCLEVGKTYTFYGDIAAAKSGYAGCLRMDYCSAEK